MKKIFALIIVLILPLFITLTDFSKESLLTQVERDGLSKKEKDLKWEFVKDKLFEGKIDRTYIDAAKIEGPILFELKHATKQDSLALQEIIQELKTVIVTTPIAYFTDFVGGDLEFYRNNLKGQRIKDYSYSEILSSTIIIDFDKDKEETKIIKTGVSYEGFLESKPQAYSFNRSDQFVDMYFTFQDTTSFYVRKKHLQYQVIKTLAFIHRLPKSKALLNITYPVEATFNEPTYTVTSKGFTEFDKFLLQKLYSKDFKKQFKDYIYATYPFRYANLFIDKNLTQFKAQLIIVCYGIVVFILAFGVFREKNLRYSYLDYFFPFLVLFISIMNLESIYTYFVQIQLSVSFVAKNSFFYLVVLITLFSWLLWQIEKRKVDLKDGFSYRFFLKLIFTFITLNLPVFILYLLYRDVEGFHWNFWFFLFLGLTLTRGLLIYLNHFSELLLKQKDIELSRLEELNAQNELKSLHAHINPHFLYNALNSIASLTHESASKAEDMILSLSDLFKYSINRKGKKMSTVNDEVLMVENYLKIEKIRFEKRLNFTIEVEEKLLKHKMPMYILQPLIENSVKHGISKSKKDGKIHLQIKEKDESLVISVFDNGPLFPENLFGGHGFQSVHDLLRLSYKEKASIHWENYPEKKITIIIPSKN